MNEQQLVALIQQKKYDEALEILFQAIEEQPEDPTHYINVGTILADAGKIEEAERFFQKSITLDPEHGGAYYGLANIYFNQERYEEAVTLYQQAVKHQLEDADTLYMLGMSYVNTGDYKAALPYLMRSYELKSEDQEIAFQYGLVLCQLEMFEEAVLVLKGVLNNDQNHTDALYNLALAQYMLDEDAAGAIDKFKKVLDIQPDHLLAGHAVTMFEQLKGE